MEDSNRESSPNNETQPNRRPVVASKSVGQDMMKTNNDDDNNNNPMENSNQSLANQRGFQEGPERPQSALVMTEQQTRQHKEMNNPHPLRPQLRCLTGSGLPEGHSEHDSCCSSRAENSPQQVGLLYYNREPLMLKDFNAEVRALMDVEQFAHQAELMLDMSQVSMDDIIEAMLAKVIESEHIGRDGERLDEAREAIFIPNSSMLIARTIQGVSCEADREGQQREQVGLKHDQSWLCALCNLAQISRRHMVIARFKHPINMGENAHEVRLFVLIVVPSQEKGTKGEVETGRTFATMLADAQFRQMLLRAATPTEFKALMVAKAQQLAKSGTRLKNRHKYLLDAAVNHSLSSITLEDGSTRNGTPSMMQLDELAKSPDSSCKQMDLNNNNNNDLSSNNLDELFKKNPRTCKLFELISPSSSAFREQINVSYANRGAHLEHNLIIFKQHNTGGPVDGDTKQFAFRPVDLDSIELNGNKKNSDGSRGQSQGCCAEWGLEFGKGLWEDFTRRVRLYPSDFRDGFVGPPRTIQKTVATIWFLYFGILLPTIAFSSLNTSQTHGHMGDLRKAIIGQAIGGLGFALLGGQPLVIIMTTAPLCLYTKVIHQMCLDYGFHFPAMYAAVGLWNGFFLVIYSLFGFSKLMQWCTRSTEEVFAMFIVVAFITDATKDMKKNFNRFYYTPACAAQNNQTASSMAHQPDDDHHQLNVAKTSANLTGLSSRELEDVFENSSCRRETSLLFLLLMLGTLWLAITLYKFKKTPYLSAGKRELLADYALPTAVILMSFIGSSVFDEIFVEKFPPVQEIHFERAQVESLPVSGILTALGLGFTLSLLFFMDQNISAAMVNAPQNRLKKPSAYHYDLFVVGLLNGALALFGLPMMHGVLPHSPLHVRSLADIEERVEEGHLREVVVNCRETRVTAVVAHILVLASVLLIPHPIAYIPRAVLNGLFLYMAVTSLDGLQMFERILLLFTEQNKYPPNHYIRRCPQRKIHKFTILQLFQLVVMCLFGFSPVNIVEMFFPVIILLMIPFRLRIVPKYIEEKYLEALDGKH